MNSPETTAFTESSAVTTGDQRKMDAALKAKWVAALRSDNYQQTKGMLRSSEGFCCLGVLADIQNPEWIAGCPYVAGKNVAFAGHLEALVAGGVEMTSQRILAGMNDGGKSFSQIADYIEQNL